MSESKGPDARAIIDLASKTPEATAFPTIPSASSGKLYDWSLPVSEQPPFVALPRSAMAERTDDETAAIFASAVERTAALFTVVSRNNGYEGRDPTIITEDLHCGTVAGLLGIDIDMLARVLIELESRGLVVPAAAGGLQLRNIDELDRLSDGPIGRTEGQASHPGF